MKIKNKIELNAFLDAVKQCGHDVKLHSPYGDVYNLKSKLSSFVAIGELLGEHGDELELFCDSKDDEQYFFRFFKDYPNVLNGDRNAAWECDVNHSEWVYAEPPIWRCSFCNEILDQTWFDPILRGINVCPHCGALMEDKRGV